MASAAHDEIASALAVVRANLQAINIELNGIVDSLNLSIKNGNMNESQAKSVSVLLNQIGEATQWQPSIRYLDPIEASLVTIDTNLAIMEAHYV